MAAPVKLGRLIGEGKVAEIFEYGSVDVLKLYRAGSAKHAAFREAAILSVLEAAGVPAPHAHGVSQLDGRWGILMSRVPGPPFADFLNSEPLSAPHLNALAQLQLGLHRISVPQLPALKSRLAANIARADALAPQQKADLLADLAQLPDGERLCHGDFHPWNVMGEPGAAIIVDWLDAAAGPPAADICRSYVLLSAVSLPLAERYVETYASLAGLDLAEIWRWRRVVAGARLAENVPAETARLLSMVGPAA